MTTTTSEVLVVDLDGTLLRSDMLYESFWSALGRDWRTPLRVVQFLLRGKAALKSFLSQTANVDVSTLPYDDDVIAHIRSWRSKGGRTALVTATDQDLADQIAAHLGIFDVVHGSDGTTNLKGATKAAFLNDTFGTMSYVYMGDSAADLAVWKTAAGAVVVNAASSVRSQVETLDLPIEVISRGGTATSSYLKALRPHQWLKNVLVFLPMLTAHQLNVGSLMLSLLAFIAFSLIASSVYVLNDLMDLKSDRGHPRKCKRPFAAGKIPIAHGTWMASGLLVAGGGLSLLLGPLFALTMTIYYLTTLAYSINLKRRAVADICVLAGLYTMRIVAGGVATEVTLSVWLLAFSIFFFFSLAAIKRQAELVDMAARGKLDASGRGYSVNDLQIIPMMALGAGYVSILIMALYVNTPTVAELYSTPAMLWGISCVLLYWISRLVLITHRGHMHDDPVVYAAKDRMSQLCGLLIFGFALLGAVV